MIPVLTFAKAHYKTILFYVVAVLLLYGINACTPMANDDFYYGLQSLLQESGRATYSKAPIDSWQSLVEAIRLNWCGQDFRFGDNLVRVLIFLGEGRSLFNVLNTLVLMLTGCMLAKLTWGTCRAGAVALAGLVFFVMCPLPAATCIWMTGAMNYLWGTCYLLVFLLCLSHTAPHAESASGSRRNCVVVLGCLMAFLTAWNHEGMGATICASLLVYWVANRFRSNIPLLYACFAGAGMLILVLSPAFQARLGMSMGYIPFKILVIGKGQIIAEYAGVQILLTAALLWLRRRDYKAAFTSFYTPFTLISLGVYLFSCNQYSWDPAGPAYFPCMALCLAGLFLARPYVKRFARMLHPSAVILSLLGLTLAWVKATEWKQAAQFVREQVLKGESSIVMPVDPPQRPIPMMLKLAFGQLPTDYISILSGPYFQTHDYWVVFNRFSNLRVYYSEFPEPNGHEVDVLRKGGYYIIRLPEDWMCAGTKLRTVFWADRTDGKRCNFNFKQHLDLYDRLKYPFTKQGPLRSWCMDYQDGLYYVILEVPEREECTTLHLPLLNVETDEEITLTVSLLPSQRSSVLDASRRSEVITDH